MNTDQPSLKYQSIWRKTLNETEKVQYEFSTATSYKVFTLILWIVLGIACFLFSKAFGILFIIIGCYTYWSLGLKVYAFTTHRVLIHTGWLSTKSTSIKYEQILEVSVQESFVQRILTKSGNLSIRTGGIGHDLLLKDIRSPYEAKKILDQLSHNTQNKPQAII